ncbi:PaaI family thioesterase [Williamsia sp. 1135]|uniref:PaaI family thioesterase n=1 Tax=Williamsia sp. 1135 TaxID=1889262 RepID=UPI000A1016D7|nr:PaaI family thioesterase [Williamsia sp. 1135]ORM31869.1 esterase [Williamsia sp. 1135]
MTEKIDVSNSDASDWTARGFDAEIGLQYKDVTPDAVRAEFTVTDKLLQPFGIVHGGVYCAVIESVASISGQVWLVNNVTPDGHVVGVNNSTDFLRAVKTGNMTAQSKPIHRGRRQQLWEVDVADENGKLIAQGRVRLQNITES